MNYTKILLASHNTPGARAAERAALAIAADSGATIDHLVVVPDLWKGMTGDDWLNNAATQQQYGSYVEAELQRELQEHSRQLEQQVTARGVDYHCRVEQGEPDRVVAAIIADGDYDLVVMGGRRPKGVDGLRSRMLTERLHQLHHAPLLVIPYPIKGC